jgi:endogenous inhibitor of DNA gyrase (YacG/DUF329 family)
MSTQTCATCGETVDLDADPAAVLGWSTSVDSGRTLQVCPACARAHVRSIEAKLDVVHW